MQYLLNKGTFNFGTTTKANEFNPYHEFVDDIQNRRSKLFPDRKRIPGRKTKFIFAIAFLIQGFATMKLLQAKRVYGKSAPYFQSITDIEYTIVKHRMDLILAEIFKEKGGIKYIEKNAAYHNPKVFAPARGIDGYSVWTGAGTGRYAQTVQTKLLNNYVSGFNIQNA